MKTVTLSRTDSRRYQEDPGALAERLVDDAYQDYSRGLASDFDLASQSGAVVEVKSTQTELANGAAGRFRLFKSQHDSLRRRDRSWYVFVVVDVSDRPLTARLVRKDPASIGRIVGSKGGWYDAGHTAGPERKLPIGAIFD